MALIKEKEDESNDPKILRRDLDVVLQENANLRLELNRNKEMLDRLTRMCYATELSVMMIMDRMIDPPVTTTSRYGGK
jgi:hypothetical protein